MFMTKSADVLLFEQNSTEWYEYSHVWSFERIVRHNSLSVSSYRKFRSYSSNNRYGYNTQKRFVIKLKEDLLLSGNSEFGIFSDFPELFGFKNTRISSLYWIVLFSLQRGKTSLFTIKKVHHSSFSQMIVATQVCCVDGLQRSAKGREYTLLLLIWLSKKDISALCSRESSEARRGWMLLVHNLFTVLFCRSRKK